MLVKLSSWSLERFWSQKLGEFPVSSEPIETPNLFAFAPLNTSKWWGNWQCTNHSGLPQVFDYETKFFTHCFISTVAILSISLLLAPILYRFYDLYQVSPKDDDQPTLRGQLAALLALVTPLLAMSNCHALVDLAVLTFGLLIAGLHIYQDSRVVVCSPELLLYWSIMVPVYFGWALGNSLAGNVSYMLWLAALSSALTFYCELVNKERSPMNSFDDTSVFSKLTVNYVTPAMKLAQTNDFGYEVLPEAPRVISSEQCYSEFHKILMSTPECQKYRVLRVMLRHLAPEISLIIGFDVLNNLIGLFRPKLLQLMLASLRDYNTGSQPLFRCYYYAVVFACFPLLSYALRTIGMLANFRGSLKSRVSLMSEIYRKGLSLAPSAQQEYDSAKLMSLISVDTNLLFRMANLLPKIVTTPIVLPIALWQLYSYLGGSVTTAGILYLVFLPLTSTLSSRMGKINPVFRKVNDLRIKTTSNVFRNIKSLKLYAWEPPFFKRISKIRLEETRISRKFQLIDTGIDTLWDTLSDYAAIVIFAAFLYFRVGILKPEIVFPALILMDRASDYIMVWPNMIPSLLRTLNAETRINDLLIQEEREQKNYSQNSVANFSSAKISVRNATLSWNGENSEDTVPLREVSFEASRGDLVCIIGRVGAGKTALLKALGGEIPIVSGGVEISGSMSYCSQEPWLQNMSVRDNILFGQLFCERWYSKVVQACQLAVDIEQMPNGDLTEIGERGITLSGGQKARVALARAIYSRSDIVLLDDVLSAVDEHVGAALIRHVLSIDGLLANRTIILATNNVKILSQSSLVVALEQKSVVEIASFVDVIRKGPQNSQIYRLIEEFEHATDLKVDPESLIDRRKFVNSQIEQAALIDSEFSTNSSEPTSGPAWLPTVQEVPLKVVAANVRTEQDDKEETDDRKNSTALHVFQRYFRLLPPYFFGVLVGSLILASLSNSASTIYLGYMSNKGLATLDEGKWYFVTFLVLVSSKSSMAALAKIWDEVVIGIRLSRLIHDRMLWNVMHAPMQFFDVTPIGRLINRFSGDISQVDYAIPYTAQFFLQRIMSLIITVSTIVIGSPIIAIFMLPLVWFGNHTRKLYVPARRKASRMVSAANSPILSHIEDSIKGQAIVRTFGRTDHFIEVHDLRVNYWIRASFFSRNLSRWLGFHMQIISVSLSLVTALSFTFLTGLGLISVGYAAVMNNFAIRAGRLIGSLINFVAQAEMNSVALERALEYVDVEQEGPPHIESTEPPQSWPDCGSIQFKDLVARYRPTSPDVLKNLVFSINSGEKIGIVGRTGSGKSTLALTLFRILEAREGHIDIDSRDISLLGLNDLRSRLSIIPQDAQVFNGTIRSNLDPLGECEDEKLWKVLEICHLKGRLEEQGKNLDTELNESGVSLSRGESQLLCLGRALLRKSKVLVLDEATASVDVETDRVIQSTIRKEFSDRTIITIAHRLHTIMDSTRILVLDHGQLTEFDTPKNLLNHKGQFYALYNAESQQKEDSHL